MPVYARVTEMVCPPTAVDLGIRFDRDHVVPEALAHDGCVGLLFLVDRMSGGSLTISLWASEDDLEASEHLGNQLRDSSAQLVDAHIGAIHRYEVTLCTGISPLDATG